MKDFQARSVDLDSAMVAYLEEVAKKYSLSDTGKALRCLVNYARENPERSDDIFDEVRCLGC